MPEFRFSALAGRRLHLVVCGSIAAYKAVELMRMAMKAGLGVGVTVTPAAARFVTPLTFASLGADVVYEGMFGQEDGTVYGHLNPGASAHTFVVAPATADFLFRTAHGAADTLAAAQALAFPGPLVIAPAMNPRMWANEATRENVAVLRRRGHTVLTPECGAVACGDEGQGRLVGLGEILLHALKACAAGLADASLEGRKILVTLGPTREAWDGVRFWTNRSTGLMGAALVTAAWLRGAEVHAVAGPGVPGLPEGVRRHDVESARQMHERAMELWPEVDAGICTAAVADFSPEPHGPEKFKKSGATDGFSLRFTPNPDILADLALARGADDHRRLLGFAAETGNLEAAVMDKLTRKKVDIIAGNLVGRPGSGFGSPTNTLFTADRAGRSEHWPSQSKADVAWRLLDWLFSL
jgi:phosphopantothenoylcysteine decarboxylase/phosphopantothenate--cysteine ligase